MDLGFLSGIVRRCKLIQLLKSAWKRFISTAGIDAIILPLSLYCQIVQLNQPRRQERFHPFNILIRIRCEPKRIIFSQVEGPPPGWTR